jgi:hypothetical protein
MASSSVIWAGAWPRTTCQTGGTRRRASPPSGSSTATGGSYSTNARNADGAARVLSRATTAPGEWPTSSGRSPAAAATASTSATSAAIASAPAGAASAWPSR